MSSSATRAGYNARLGQLVSDGYRVRLLDRADDPVDDAVLDPDDPGADPGVVPQGDPVDALHLDASRGAELNRDWDRKGGPRIANRLDCRHQLGRDARHRHDVIGELLHGDLR